jgi:hypothetical protein
VKVWIYKGDVIAPHEAVALVPETQPRRQR